MTGRPRSVAGRRAEAPEPESPQPGTAAPVEPPTSAPEEPAAPAPEPSSGEAPGGEPVRDSRPGRSRATVALVGALVVLAGVLAGEAWYLWFAGKPVVSASRPVVTSEVSHRAAVEAARQSVSEILSYGYQDFDEQIDEATSMMTDSFAEEFRRTADDVEQEFVAERTEQDVRVVAASVVQASSQQVLALLFLDQYVVKATDGTSITPYRALVTMVHTEGGWLVSDIETK